MERKHGLTQISILVLLFILLTTILGFNIKEICAEEFPSRPIKIILPFGPGGINHVIWRTISESMSKTLNTPVVIENKPGGGTSLAWTLLSKAKPDGYTTAATPVTSVTNTFLAYKVEYDPVKSFTPIAGTWQYNEVLAIKSGSPWKNWEEFLSYVTSNPDKAKIGFSNPIGSAVLTMKLIAKKNNFKWREIVTTGEGELVTQLLGGHIDAFVGAGVVHTLLKDGRAIPILAITNEKMPNYPEVPCANELYGIDSLNVAGYTGPAGIPTKIVKKLESALQIATKSKEYERTMEQMGAVVRFRTSKEFSEDFRWVYDVQKGHLKELGLIRAELR